MAQRVSMTKPSSRAHPCPPAGDRPADPTASYVLDEQIGFVLRKAHQRATATFMSHFGPHRLTPTQWATLVRIREYGAISQNRLGRLTAMDPATIQGVVQRLIERELIIRVPDPTDGRRKKLSLTTAGAKLAEGLMAKGFKVSRETLRPLRKEEQKLVLSFLARLG
jgi:MarR family transcriptional regulator, lower aerobic nicotinate degradation pathway regulator